jgi:tetratricopeptide (TPR) repeat protein
MSLNRQAKDAIKRGDNQNAEQLLLQSVAIGEASGFGFSPNSADELAKIYTEQKRYADAEQMLLKSKTITARDFRNGNLLLMRINLQLARLYMQAGQLPKAQANLEEAFTYWSSLSQSANKYRISSNDSRKLAAELAQASTAFAGSGRLSEAENCAKSAAEIGTLLASGENGQHYYAEAAIYDCLLGKLYYRNKKYKSACAALNNCIELRKDKSTSLDWELAEPLHYYALSLASSNQGAKAKEINLELAPNWPGYTFEHADAWSDKMADAANAFGSYHNEEIDSAREALEIAKKWSVSDIRYADTEARLAILLHKAGKYEEAPGHFFEAIRIANIALKANKPAVAARCEHWGKLVEDTGHYTGSAPWPVYREALSIRQEITKPKDETAFKGAKQIANYCKNQLTHFPDEQLFAMFSDACNVMVKAHGLADEQVLDSMHDLIAARERRYQYDHTQALQAPTIALYKEVLKGEKDLYGMNSSEVHDTASSMVTYLKTVNLNDEAAVIARDYKIK